MPAVKLTLYRSLIVTLAVLFAGILFGFALINLLVNLVALIQISRIMVYYNKTTNWYDSAVGRTTMAVKAVLLLLAGTGMVGRALELITYHSCSLNLVPLATCPTRTITWLSVIEAAAYTVVWVLTTAAISCRLRVIKNLQLDNPEDPGQYTPEAYEPSSGVRDDGEEDHSRKE